MMHRIGISLIFIAFFYSCQTVKPYQQMYLNNKEMALSSKKITQYEMSSQNYREGTSGANGSKAGGGCGCN